MTSFRVLVMSAVALGTVGWLQADTVPADPLVKFTTNGGGSTHITCIVNGCETDLSPAIGPDGFATLDVFNGTGKNIAAMTFVIPTTNFDQDFFASSNAFESAAIFADEEGQSISVQFSGVGNVGTGEGFLPADVTAASGPAGFVPGGIVEAFVFFGNAPAGSTFAGFANGQEATLTLTTPEPNTLWLSLSGALGLLAVRRRLRKT